MSDTYGGGLDLQSGAPLDISPAAVNAMPPFVPDNAPAPVPPGAMTAAPDTAPGTPQSGGFGSSLQGFGKLLLPPSYNSGDPNASPLDKSANLLQQQADRANQIGTNPVVQFLAPEKAAAARAAIPQITEKLQQIQTQKAAVQAGRAQADTLGLTPGEAPDQATQDDRINVAVNKAVKGDVRAFQGIQAIAPDRAAAIAPQVYNAVAGHLSNAQLAFDSFAGMQNEGQYQAKIKQLRADGTLTDLEAMGLKLPPTFDAFNANKAAEGLALRNARIGVNSIGQQLEARNTYNPMDTKLQDTYRAGGGAQRTIYGDQLNLGPYSENRAAGTRGQMANGIATVDDYGKTGNAATPEQRKEIGETFKEAVTKENLDKIRNLNRIGSLAVTDTDGKFIPPEGIQKGRERIFLNTNPNTQQGLAEGFAAALRGGGGGANGQLLNIEVSKRGAVQALLDKIKSGYNGGLDVITGNQVRGYLTELTQQQQRQVLDGLREYNEKSLGDRALYTARRAGALGLDSSVLGLGKDEASGAIGDAIEEGRRAQVEQMRPNFQPIGGGNGVLQIAAQRPGAGAADIPPGAQRANQLPGAQPLLTPVQQATQTPGASSAPNPAPPSPSGTPSGGAGPNTPVTPVSITSAAPQPVTVAGQQVNVALPAGVSPQYAQAVQRIETGNEKSPWTAGTKNTSAGGAFQAVKDTWNQYKPPGAPARAADATSQQQADFLSKFTAANAQSLRTAGLPVNDTNLYVAHNLGATGAASLLEADPNADARTVVGETAAKNNPTFFRGRPTVAIALQRYAAAMNGPDNITGTPAASGAPAGATDGGPPPVGAGKLTPPGILSWLSLTPAQKQQMKTDVINQAPAIGGTAGAVVGSVVGGGVPGGMAGGAIGSGAGQSLKDYLQGRPQDPIEIAKQSALGGVLGVASAGGPAMRVAAAAARVGGSAAIDAGAEAAKGGTAADVVDAGIRGGVGGLAGEALGRFVSSAGAAAYKGLSRYTTEAQSELSAQAGKLAQARETLKTEQPELPGDMGANPKYEAAKKAETEAIAAIKDHGQNPDDMVHAYEQATAGVSAGEAAVTRKAASEKTAVSQGYNQLRQDVRETGVGAPKPNQPLPDGPVAQVRTAENPTGSVEAKFTPDAEHAEMLVKAPAKDWGEKWQQLQDAGSELIQKRMAFLQNGDRPSADAMDNIFQGVRNQQKAAANYVFGPEKGAQVISQIESLDQRYAKLMNATQGMNYQKMRNVMQGGNTPERRTLEQNFKAFAGDDPTAMRAFSAMRAGAKGRISDEAKLMTPLIAAETLTHLGGIPSFGVVSASVGGHRLYKIMQEYANAKLLGRPVTFKDYLNQELTNGAGSTVGTIARNAVQRPTVQGDVLAGMAP